MLNDNLVNVCLTLCDPVGEGCPDGDVCIPLEAKSSQFFCIFDGSFGEGQVFDGCANINHCDPGLLCAHAQLPAMCDANGTGCCLPFCDLDQPACPDETTCIPWFDEGTAPAGLEDLGLCVAPAP
jgi:hypothetical protein